MIAVSEKPLEALERVMFSALCTSAGREKPGYMVAHAGADDRELLRTLTSDMAGRQRFFWGKQRKRER